MTEVGVAKAPSQFWKAHSWVIALGAAALALPLLVVLPRLSMNSQVSPPSHFGTKGGKAPGPVLESNCSPACRVGDVLMLRLNGEIPAGYVSAFAENEKNRIWYFPSESGKTLQVPASKGATMLPEGIRFGQDKGFITAKPVLREDIAQSLASH